MTSTRRFPAWLTALLGAVGLVAVWWIISAAIPAGPGGFRTVPTPPDVVTGFLEAGADYYLRHFSVTLAEAGVGYLWGNLIALAVATLVLLMPRLEAVIMQLATITYCLPIVAIGSLILIIAGAPKAGEASATAVILAGLSVFFTTVVGSILGFKAADSASLDVVHVYGGGRLTQLRKVRLIAALPHILNALQIAVPAAFLGAVLGEFFGKVTRGVGPAMTVAQQALDSPRLWGIALASGAVALLGYALVGLVARAVAPWSKGVAS